MRNRALSGMLKMAPGAKLKIAGRSVRPDDQTRYTRPSSLSKREKRIRANAAAKKARRTNRQR